MLNTIKQRREPWQRVLFDHIDLCEAQLFQAPIGDIPDVTLDLFRGHAVHRTHLKSEVDKGVFEPHGLLTNVDNVFFDRFGQAIALFTEGVEHLDDAFAMQAFIADRPADDLAHALHLVEAREVHQHREAGEQLQPLGKAAEHGERAGDVLVIVDAELLHVIVFVGHFLIFEEGAVFAFGHADRVEQVRIGGDVHRLHIGEGGEHHLDLCRFEHAAIFVVVAILHFDIGLGEESKDLGEQVALMLSDLLRPVAAILAQGHFFGHPVDLLLTLPEVVSPRVFERLVGLTGFEQRHVVFP